MEKKTEKFMEENKEVLKLLKEYYVEFLEIDEQTDREEINELILSYIDPEKEKIKSLNFNPLPVNVRGKEFHEISIKTQKENFDGFLEAETESLFEMELTDIKDSIDSGIDS